MESTKKFGRASGENAGALSDFVNRKPEGRRMGIWGAYGGMQAASQIRLPSGLFLLYVPRFSVSSLHFLDV